MSIGPVLGTYEILNRLSVGGMGEVYLAEDTRLHRKVALKVLPPEWGSDPERLERFQWEARVLATLNHPNIVTIYSVEKHDDVHFFTMELVEGQTLREVIPEHGLPLSRFLELAIPLADALSAAHQRGIIHRDIKPGNIMVRPDGRLKILDFGLAKREPGNGDPDAALKTPEPQTQDGRLLGTVAYMSPEQMAGKPLDHRADLFTLGIVFYEMLTGVRPFEDTHWAERITTQLQEKEPPSAPPEAQLPRRLEEVIHRCLERDPEKRYQTAEQLREDLTELQLEIVSGSFSSTQIARPDFGRPKRLWMAAGAGVLAVFVLLAVFLIPRVRGFTADRAPPEDAPVAPGEVVQKRIAVLPFENLGAPEDSYFAKAISEEIVSRLASVSALKVVRAPAPAGGEPPGIADLGVDYLLGGTVFWSDDGAGQRRVRVIPLLTQVSDGAHLWSEQYEHVLDDVFKVQSEIAEEVIRQLNIRLAEAERQILSASHTHNVEAYEAFLRAMVKNAEAWEAFKSGMEYASRHEPSRRNWELAVEMLERAVRLDPGFAPAHAELSRVHSFFYHQKIDRTPERLALALESAERALELVPDLPDGHRALGYYYYWGRGDYERALDEFHTAVRLLPGDSQLYEGIAYIRRRQGRFEDALENLRKAQELNPKSNWLAVEMAHTYTNLRDFEKADVYYDRAIALGPDQPHPYQLKALNALRWTGDVERAQAILAEMPRQDDTSSLYTRFKVELIARNLAGSKALLRQIESDLVGLDSALFPKELSRGGIYFIEGNREQAGRYYDMSRRTLENKVRERPDDARLRSALGLTYAGLVACGADYKDEAIREGQRAVDLYPIENDAFVGPEFLEHLAVIYAWVGEKETALGMIRELLDMPSGLSRAYLRVNPRWDPLRGDPRFERIVADS